MYTCMLIPNMTDPVLVKHHAVWLFAIAMKAQRSRGYVLLLEC